MYFVKEREMSQTSHKHKTLENENMRISYREGFVENQKIFENHCHARYEMISVFEGSVGIVVDNKRYTLKEGELAIIPPLVYHSVFAKDTLMYKRATILFDEKLIPTEIKDDFAEKTKYQSVSIHESFCHLFERLKDVFADEENKKFLPLVSSILIEALYIHTYKDTSGKRDKSHPVVNRAAEYINNHLADKITLDDVAASLFLSKSTVSHVFRDELKISVKQYILQKKIAYAASLICDGVSAGEAAEIIGYDNYANFYKMYKKIIGTTPKETVK